MSTLAPDKTIAEGSGGGAIALGGRAGTASAATSSTRSSPAAWADETARTAPPPPPSTSATARAPPWRSSSPNSPPRWSASSSCATPAVPAATAAASASSAEYRILQDEVRFSMRTDKHALAPQGIDGGHPGGTGDCIINPGREDERSLPSRFGDQRLKTGDVLRVERPGGGGVGVAFERSPGSGAGGCAAGDMCRWRRRTERLRSSWCATRAAGIDLDSEGTSKLRGEAGSWLGIWSSNPRNRHVMQPVS